MVTYQEFLDSKVNVKSGNEIVINPKHLHPSLYDFQSFLVSWALQMGRAGIFADCGLGKTPMQLTWAYNVFQETGKPVLIITPLAVTSQTIREAGKFGFEIYRSGDGTVHYPITITNYERLHYFNPLGFSGVVCDESSILKSFDGTRKAQITEFMRVIPYRLLCTATAAPNDYTELGTSSEALGYLGYMDMLTRFFTNKQNTSHNLTGRWRSRQEDQWRFKGHAEDPFWRWVSSWARATRKPSDLGFDDSDFELPELNINTTLVKAATPRPGMLFDVEAIGFHEEREVRRRTIKERCESAADKVSNSGEPAVVWCHLNDEANLLEQLIPDAVQISGKDSDESKEEKFENFRTGDDRVLIIKPKIGAWGLNWQHCSHVVYFANYSYEQYYQAVRRCWRFGQKNPVTVDIIGSDADSRIFEALKRKSDQSDQMFTNLVSHMMGAIQIERNNQYEHEVMIPSWL